MLQASASVAQPPQPDAISVTSPPKHLRLDPFYVKYVGLDGLPIVSSAKVPDQALLKARRIAAMMVAANPSLLHSLVDRKVRIAVMSESEVTTDIPEHRGLRPMTRWNRRTRGLGATPQRPACSCAEENLLDYESDPYRGENILIHELAHTLHEMAIVNLDNTFDTTLRACYRDAMERGMWSDSYAATNHREYWAEGVQSWFNANQEADPPDGIHNGINTREELEAYDPALAALISSWFANP